MANSQRLFYNKKFIGSEFTHLLETDNIWLIEYLVETNIWVSVYTDKSQEMLKSRACGN